MCLLLLLHRCSFVSVFFFWALFHLRFAASSPPPWSSSSSAFDRFSAECGEETKIRTKTKDGATPMNKFCSLSLLLSSFACIFWHRCAAVLSPLCMNSRGNPFCLLCLSAVIVLYFFSIWFSFGPLSALSLSCLLLPRILLLLPPLLLSNFGFESNSMDTFSVSPVFLGGFSCAQMVSPQS